MNISTFLQCKFNVAGVCSVANYLVAYFIGFQYL